MRVFIITLIIVLAYTITPSVYCVHAENENSGKEGDVVISPTEPAKGDKDLSIASAPEITKNESRSFFDFINKKVYADPAENKDDKKKLREKWEELTGVDVFYPYFKAQEIEDWVKEKFRVRVFNMKGRMKFDDNKSDANIVYIFSLKF